jgi:hypothetical protein
MSTETLGAFGGLGFPRLVFYTDASRNLWSCTLSRLHFGSVCPRAPWWLAPTHCLPCLWTLVLWPRLRASCFVVQHAWRHHFCFRSASGFVSLRASSSQRTCPQRVRLAGMLTSTSLLAQRPAGATRVIIGNRVQTPCPARMVPEFRLIALGGKLRPPPKTRPKVRKHTFMCEGTGWRLEARHNHRSIECMRFLSFGNRTYVQRCRASRRACIRHHHPPTYNMRHH